MFGPVWSALYTAMGVASWMVFKQGGFSAQVRREPQLHRLQQHHAGDEHTQMAAEATSLTIA